VPAQSRDVLRFVSASSKTHGQDYEVRYTAKKAKRSAGAVKKAVKKVGSSRKRVKRRLGR
jgi:Protein of unknown function (DUF3606)